MYGVTMEDRITNARIRETVKVREVLKKTQEARFRWYGHVMRSNGDSDKKGIMDMEVQGRRRKGRPKTRWKDCIAADMRKKGPGTNMTGDRCRWKRIIKNSNQV